MYVRKQIYCVCPIVCNFIIELLCSNIVMKENDYDLLFLQVLQWIQQAIMKEFDETVSCTHRKH